MRWLYKAGKVAGLLFLMASADYARADFTSMIRSLTMSRLDIEMQIVNEQGQAVPGAHIWQVGYWDTTAPKVAVNAAIFSRWAWRYAGQSDFLEVDDFPSAVFLRADQAGVFRDTEELSNSRESFHYVYAIVKRGYVPEVIEGALRLSERRTLKVVLKKDTRARFDPRMEEFDALMAQVRAPVPGENLVGEDRKKRLDSLKKKAYTLAQSLEKDGLNDEASAAYWALANFPEVILVKSPDGATKVVGYDNGGTGERADAEKAHAIMLNRSVPKLLLQKSLLQQGYKGKGIHDAEKGRAYLKIFYDLASGPMHDQILPREYEVAIYQELRWGTPENACKLLKRAFQFDQAMMGENDWQSFAKQIKSLSIKRGAEISCDFERL